MRFVRDITTLNPFGLILRQHKLADIQLESEIINVIDNDYLAGYRDYFIKLSAPLPGLLDSIITTDQGGNIESIIHQYKKEYFRQILDLLEQLEDHIEVTKPKIDNGEYIIFDRGAVFTNLWLLNGDTKVNIQHATKDFIQKLAD